MRECIIVKRNNGHGKVCMKYRNQKVKHNLKKTNRALARRKDERNALRVYSSFGFSC